MGSILNTIMQHVIFFFSGPTLNLDIMTTNQNIEKAWHSFVTFYNWGLTGPSRVPEVTLTTEGRVGR